MAQLYKNADRAITPMRNYIRELEKLWDMLSDAIEGGRLTESDIPDDYQAIVYQMRECKKKRA